VGVLITIVIGYLLGSFSTSYIAGRLVAGIDIRNHGSGNAGATNTFRVLGAKTAIPVFIVDVLKGVVSVWLGYWILNGNPWGGAIGGTAAIIGHNWPIYLRFRGGRGVATTIGVMFTIALLPTLFVALVAICVLAFTRYVSLASLTFTGILPIAILVDHLSFVYFMFSLVLAALAFWRHRDNIRRLLSGTENRLGKNRPLR